MSIPYAGATIGRKAREEITRILRQFGCTEVGFLDDFAKGEVLLAFTHRGRAVQLRASSRGWAALFLRAEPWKPGRRGNRRDYEAKVLQQGTIAINSVLRDWIKGSVTAVEAGVLSVEAIFSPFMLDYSGKPMIERMVELLPPPAEEKVWHCRGDNKQSGSSTVVTHRIVDPICQKVACAVGRTGQAWQGRQGRQGAVRPVPAWRGEVRPGMVGLRGGDQPMPEIFAASKYSRRLHSIFGRRKNRKSRFREITKLIFPILCSAQPEDVKNPELAPGSGKSTIEMCRYAPPRHPMSSRPRKLARRPFSRSLLIQREARTNSSARLARQLKLVREAVFASLQSWLNQAEARRSSQPIAGYSSLSLFPCKISRHCWITDVLSRDLLLISALLSSRSLRPAPRGSRFKKRKFDFRFKS